MYTSIYIYTYRERDGQSIPWYNMYNGAFLVAMNGSYIDIKRLNNHYIILIMVIYYIMAAIIYIYIYIIYIYRDTLGELAFHGPWKIRWLPMTTRWSPQGGGRGWQPTTPPARVRDVRVSYAAHGFARGKGMKTWLRISFTRRRSRAAHTGYLSPSSRENTKGVSPALPLHRHFRDVKFTRSLASTVLCWRANPLANVADDNILGRTGCSRESTDRIPICWLIAILNLLVSTPPKNMKYLPDHHPR